MASRNVEAFKAAHQAFNRRDFDAVVAAMAEDVTYQDRARNVTFQGRAGFKEFMQGWLTAFSNAQVSEPQYTDAGDVVIAEFIARGVNDGPLELLGATGKPVTFPLCEIMRFNDKGQVVSGSAYYDQLSILAQLGHAQAPQSASARV
ncbi:MAG TPA: ester cyclase [Bryobacteraceae bacterium]|nr:ester cyclase [Bryobacteraceae bacterium]